MTDSVARLSSALADRYQIERELGAGGMATVYLAHDVRHNRKVALKVLRPELAAILGGERFLKEIQLTANLQHPHILALHDSGEADGQVYYVMPFVEGESLRDRISREHQLPVDEAVRITREVAGALDYAHRHGVVHRDIKPENILLLDGSALVADFGIALAASRSDGGTRMTETGMSLGTPHYMAPEQAMGEREITPKADIYALGCVLYEMLTGEPPFTGPTAQAIVARVMTEQPRALTIQRHTIPPHVEAAVRMALEKLPADRFTSATQFAEALVNPGSIPLMAATGAMTVPLARPLSRGARTVRMAAGAGVLALSAVAGALLWRQLGARPAASIRPVVRFGIQLPSEAAVAGATGSTIAFSPDGSRLVYVGTGPNGRRLYVRGLDQIDPVPIPGTDGASLPFFSADGTTLGFVQGGKLARVALAGGPVAPIATVPGTVYGASWTTTDTIIIGADSGLMDVPATGGALRIVAKPDSGEQFLWPEVLPGDRAVLFTAAANGSLKLAALDRRSGQVTRTTQVGAYPRYVNAGFVVLTDVSGIISAVPFDVTRLRVSGAAMPLVDKMPSDPRGDLNFGVARSGDFAWQTTPTAGSRLLLVARDGAVRGIASDTGYYNGARLSPDGQRIAVARNPAFGAVAKDVWVIDLQQHTRTRLTFDTTADSPAWSPDGRRVAFQWHNGRVAWAPADGSGAPDSLPAPPGGWGPVVFEPGGAGLLVHGVRPGQSYAEIWRVDLHGGEPRQIVAGQFHNYNPSLSPDGRWMAYNSAESGRLEVYVRPYPGPGGRWQVSLNGGAEPVWSASGREIFYRERGKVMSATVRTQPAFDVTSRTELFTGAYATGPNNIREYSVTPDGQTLMMREQLRGIEQSVFVTLNWFDHVRRPGSSR